MYAIYNAEANEFLTCTFKTPEDARLFLVENLNLSLPNELVEYKSKRHVELQRLIDETHTKGRTSHESCS